MFLRQSVKRETWLKQIHTVMAMKTREKIREPFRRTIGRIIVLSVCGGGEGVSVRSSSPFTSLAQAVHISLAISME